MKYVSFKDVEKYDEKIGTFNFQIIYFEYINTLAGQFINSLPTSEKNGNE